LAKFILVRHGETKLNTPPEMIRGWIDVPLDAHGDAQSKGIAQMLKDIKPIKLFSSNLQRAKHTADEISKIVDVPVTATERLRPWNVGKYAGVDIKTVIKDVQKLIESPNKKAPEGESFNDFVHRFLAILERIATLATVNKEPVIAVTHSRNIRVAHAWADGGYPEIIKQPASTWLAKAQDPVEPGGYVEFNWKGSRWAAGEPHDARV
jgi:glucosyl-3-phosphoglycerate phosphatase